MTVFLLAVSSFIAWVISSLAGGGSPFIIIPMVNILLEAPAIPPVVTTGMLLGNLQRVFVFWQDIDWRLTWWYLPGAVSGAILGAIAFTQTHLEWIQTLLGLFLVSSAFSMFVGESKPSFQVPGWVFLPAGFIHAFLSGLLGSIGPILNPLYLNYGLFKEKMIGTKSAHVLVVHIAKMCTYASLGAFTKSYLWYGLVIGMAAIPANWVGQQMLQKMSNEQFHKFVTVLITISGLSILWNQRKFFAILLQ
ncbi:sulfite exporter TauE/SafE family protein [Chroococcidiopsidales cyanobacterium LEGE 13417]|nr:sulfite exporter TauE/SafE family protein [Chroococcidiopsidales cyanobacterium LEGE 13417]